MTRTEELQQAVTEARTAVARALAGAYGDWTRRPAREECSAKENAEHVLENELFFAGELARLKAIKAPAMELRPLETPGAAIDAIFQAGLLAQPVLDAYEDTDLATDWAHGMSAGDLLELYASHARDHVEQVTNTLALVSAK